MTAPLPKTDITLACSKCHRTVTVRAHLHDDKDWPKHRCGREILSFDSAQPGISPRPRLTALPW